MKDNNQNKKLFNYLTTVAIVLAGCGFAGHTFGIGNPAAVYCEKLGYQSVVQEVEGGQRGFCQFPDGSEADEWKFFVGEERQEYGYCQAQGYETKTIISEECKYASKCAVCVLENGKEIKVTELMNFNLESTITPWDPENKTDDKTNYLFYFLGATVLIIFLIVAFVVYKKIKNRDDYYE